MKRSNIIRVLSGLMFLIFLCPFFQMCSDRKMKKELPIDNTELAREEALQNSRDNITYSGYDMALFLFKGINELEFSDFKDPYFYFCVLLSSPPILSLFLLFFA